MYQISSLLSTIQKKTQELFEEDMAACVGGSDSYPAARSCCGIELKEYKNSFFTCSVCMMDSVDTEMYRCNRCNKARHKGCIQLRDEIMTGPGPLIGPGPKTIFGEGVYFKLFNQPQKGLDSANEEWAEYCMVCGMKVNGYSYHHRTRSSKKDLNMHPCCAELVKAGNHPPHELTLKEKPYCVCCAKKLPPGASPDGPRKFFCWSYILGNDIRIHVYCYTEMVIKALKSINPSHPNNDGKIKIVLRRRKERGNDGKTIDKAIKIGLTLAGVDATQILLNWIF